MNTALLLRHMLVHAMLIPAMTFTLIPLCRDVRRSGIIAIAVIVAAAIPVGGWLCAGLNAPAGLIQLAAMLACLAVLLIASNISPAKTAFCFLNGAMLCAFCTLYAVFLTASVELDNTDGVAYARSSLVRLGMAVAVGAAFWRTLRVKLPGLLSEARIDGVWWGFVLLPVVMTAFFQWATPISPAVVMTGRVRTISMPLFLFFPAFMLTLYHLLWWTTVRLSDTARLEQEMRILRAEGQRYRETLAYMDQTRALRHDFRQHLHVISELVGDHRYEHLEAYMRKLQQAAVDAPVRYCANPAADAIIAYYARLAEQEAIATEFDVELPEALPVSETDYCVLIGNLLENAIHALRALPEDARKLRLVSRMLTPAMLGLSVENPYQGPLPMDPSGFPVASRKNHGIGLISASAVVTRYHGTMDIRTDGGIFAVSVILCP